MTMATIHEVLRTHLKDWMRARGNKKKRGEITRLVCSAIRIHPKSVPRAMKRLQMSGTDPERRGGRPAIYTPLVMSALRDAWEAGDGCCGELLHPQIPEYVDAMKRDELWSHGDAETEKLLAMSERTVKRKVLALQKKYGIRHGASATRPSLLKLSIPVFKGPWNDLPPGNGQIDTVAHCGDTLQGDFVFTVNYTDAATYWMIPRAQWNKGQIVTGESLRMIRGMLPFKMTGLHPDSGSEFINRNLKAWCDAEGIILTRSEPGKKNDNMYVEERNGHVVRRYLGYLRYDVPEIVPVLNDLYDVLARYLNHWKAVRRMAAKERIGSKYVRRYERTAKTPYARVLGHPGISDASKERLREEHQKLNPLLLKRQIDTLRMKIYKIQQAARDGRSNS